LCVCRKAVMGGMEEAISEHRELTSAIREKGHGWRRALEESFRAYC
jgi:hypothetical protein